VKEYVRNAAGQRRNVTPVAVFVREEFSDVIRGNGFTPEDNGSNENRFRLSVRKYGFGEAGMLSRQVRPLMTLYAEMVTPDDTILWSHEAVVKADDKELPVVLPEDLRNNPDEQEKLSPRRRPPCFGKIDGELRADEDEIAADCVAG
jgi:hypothetical protein